MIIDFPKLIISLLFVGVVMGADLWTKHEVTASTQFHEESFGPGNLMTVKKPIINYGASGVFGSGTPEPHFRFWHFFVMMMAFICFVSMVYLNERTWHSAVAAIPVGGIAGNAFELVYRGGATDFLSTNGLGILDNFYLNAADFFILIGIPVYFLTEQMEPFEKILGLTIFACFTSLTLGLLPAEPSTFIAIGGLFILLFWSGARNVET